jgi:hypothetical protein
LLRPPKYLRKLLVALGQELLPQRRVVLQNEPLREAERRDSAGREDERVPIGDSRQPVREVKKWSVVLAAVDPRAEADEVVSRDLRRIYFLRRHDLGSKRRRESLRDGLRVPVVIGVDDE